MEKVQLSLHSRAFKANPGGHFIRSMQLKALLEAAKIYHPRIVTTIADGETCRVTLTMAQFGRFVAIRNQACVVSSIANMDLKIIEEVQDPDDLEHFDLSGRDSPDPSPSTLRWARIEWLTSVAPKIVESPFCFWGIK